MKQSRWTFIHKTYVLTFLLVVLTIAVTGFTCLHFALTIKQNDLDLTVENLASMTANMNVVKRDLKNKKPSKEMEKELDLLIQSFDQADVLVVCDTNSIRYYHNNKERIGQKFTGDDQYDILNGKDPYISEAEGTLGRQRRAFYPVKDEDGNIIGFVVASVLTTSRDQLLRKIVGTFVIFLFLLLGIAFCVATLIHRHLKNTLLGYDPEEFRDRFMEREEVLDALEEGIFAIDKAGDITLINESAKEMIGADPDAKLEGKPLIDILPETCLLHTLQTKTPEYNIDFTVNDHRIISSRIPIVHEDELLGAVSIFRDRTEVVQLADQLTGTKGMVDALRAFNHDFMNKLHVILGFLEVNDVEHARSYILETSMPSEHTVSNIVHQIPNETLAALLIGKMIRADELGIQLSLKTDTFFKKKEKELPVDCYITLIGNLLENAMDELNSKNFPIKEIELGIYSEEGHTIIVCDDTGGGIPPEIMETLYDRTTTTKGEGHGNGFALMKEIVDLYRGTFHIDTEAGVGTSIEIILPI